jgi:putative peptidoglycan lipid II flippase
MSLLSETEKLPNVARAGGIMMISLFASRVLGIVRESVMVGTFGRTELTDAYVLAFQIPDLLFFLVAGGALSSAFIPVFSEYLHTNREREAWRIFSAVVTIMATIVAALILIAAWYAEPLARITAAGKPDSLIPLIATMSRILLPAQFAFLIGGILFGVLYARQRFAIPGLAPNLYNIGIIFGAVLLSQFVSPGVVGMACGALLGAVVGNLILPLSAMRTIDARFRPTYDFRHPGVRKVFKLMLPVVLGLSLPGVYSIIMRWFGSFYEAGINVALNQGNQLMQAPLGIFGQALAIAAFPALAQFYAQGRMDRYREQLVTTLGTVVYLSVPVMAVMLVMADDIVTVLFQYGKFTGADTAVVTPVVQMFAIGVAAWCLHPVLMRAFFALQNSWTPILLGTLTTAIFVVLCLVLQQTNLGYLSLPLAGSLSAYVLVALLLVALRARTADLTLAPLVITLFKSVAAGVGMAIVLLVGDWVLPQGGGWAANLWALVRLVGLGLAGAWLYYGLTRFMKMPETRYVDRALGRIARQPQPMTTGDDGS